MEVLYKDYSFCPYQLTNMAEDLLEIDQSKTGIAYGSHVCKWIKKRNE
jgi:hypothetical protein